MDYLHKKFYCKNEIQIKIAEKENKLRIRKKKLKTL